MASVVFQNAVMSTFEGDIDWETDNLDARLLMTNTTADTNPDADTCADLTLDESDDGSYAHEDVTSPAVSADDANDRMVFTSDPWVWAALDGDGTRDYQGALLVKYVDGANADIPLLFVDFTSDVPKEATQVTATDPGDGFLNIGQPA
jgi:hypothetical protein